MPWASQRSTFGLKVASGSGTFSRNAVFSPVMSPGANLAKRLPISRPRL